MSDSGTPRITSARVGRIVSATAAASGGALRRSLATVRGCGRRSAQGRPAPRYRDARVVTTVPDIPVVQLPALDADGVSGLGGLTTPGSIWAVDVPSTRRLTPVTLAALGVVAGIAAMALGTAAVVSAGSSASALHADGDADDAASRRSRGPGGRAPRSRAAREAEHGADRISGRQRARARRGQRRSCRHPDSRPRSLRRRAGRTAPGSSLRARLRFAQLASPAPSGPSSSPRDSGRGRAWSSRRAGPSRDGRRAIPSSRCATSQSSRRTSASVRTSPARAVSARSLPSSFAR